MLAARDLAVWGNLCLAGGQTPGLPTDATSAQAPSGRMFVIASLCQSGAAQAEPCLEEQSEP